MVRVPPPKQVAEVFAGNAQDKGKRDSQQDAYGFTDFSDAQFRRHAGVGAVLADGMGGMQNGVWSSVHAVRSFLKSYQQKAPNQAVQNALEDALRQANALVYEEASRLNLVDRMGTTLVAAVIHERTLSWVSVGDSRIYRYSAGRMQQLSTDQSYAEILAAQVRSGQLSQAEADAHPMRNALLGYLGRAGRIEIDASPVPIPLESGDWIVLCSDGVSGVLTTTQMASCLSDDVHESARRMVQTAIARGLRNQDNATVALLRLGADPNMVAHGSHSTATYPVRSSNQNNANRGMRSTPKKLIFASAAVFGASLLLGAGYLLGTSFASREDTSVELLRLGSESAGTDPQTQRQTPTAQSEATATASEAPVPRTTAREPNLGVWAGPPLAQTASATAPAPAPAPAQAASNSKPPPGTPRNNVATAPAGSPATSGRTAPAGRAPDSNAPTSGRAAPAGTSANALPAGAASAEKPPTNPIAANPNQQTTATQTTTPLQTGSQAIAPAPQSTNSAGTSTAASDARPAANGK
jgi:protein phosphatase